MLKSAKVWQRGQSQIVWQVRLPSTDGKHRKAYLIADADKSPVALRLSDAKPEQLNAQGNMVALLRKYLKTASIKKAMLIGKDYWLVLQAGSHRWYIFLGVREKKSVIDLIDSDGISHIRIGPQGVFTKKKPAGPIPNLDSGNDILQSIVDKYHSESDSEDSEVQHREDSSKSSEERTAKQKLKRRLKTLRKSLQKAQSKQATEASIDQLETKARLLQANIHRVPDDAYEITLQPEESGLDKAITIDLDPDKSIGEFINDLFVEAKRQRRGINSGNKHLDKLAKEIHELEELLASWADTTPSSASIAESLNRFGIKGQPIQKSSTRQTQSLPYRIYQSSGPRILVGKGARENDELTKKAKANDFWIHAVGVTGSHVIVEGHRFKGVDLPPEIFKQAAILALHFSKLRADHAGEVYYTRRQNIKKQKGMPPGLWNVEHCSSVFLRYSEGELAAALDSQITS